MSDEGGKVLPFQLPAARPHTHCVVDEGCLGGMFVDLEDQELVGIREPMGCDAWALTPDQADELALLLVRWAERKRK